VIPGLYIGNYKDMANLPKLKELNITHVLSVSIGVWPIYPNVCGTDPRINHKNMRTVGIDANFLIWINVAF
jgi:hypothetical protein